jgi:hypothetical protein
MEMNYGKIEMNYGNECRNCENIENERNRKSKMINCKWKMEMEM